MSRLPPKRLTSRPPLTAGRGDRAVAPHAAAALTGAAGAVWPDRDDAS